MLTQPQRIRTHLLQAVDGVLFALALLLAYAARDWFPWLRLPVLEPLDDYFWVFPLAAVIGPTTLAVASFYAPPRLTTRLEAFFVIVRSCFFTVISLILCLFILREQLARSVIIFVGVFAAPLVYLRHELTRWLAERAFFQPQLARRVVWVGRRSENTALRASLTRTEKAMLEEIAEFDPSERAVEELVRVLHDQSVNVVILNLASLDRAAADRVLLVCAHEGVEVVVRTGLQALPSPRLVIDQFGGEAVFFYRAQAAGSVQLAIKQGIDYIGAALLLLVLSPVFLVIALSIKATSRGPVFYRQPRAGLNGRAFTMVKFRSMRADAEQAQGQLAAQNEMRGPVFKVKRDPRLTPVGAFLRRHSLDELPQLWNVLRGEMSLVGPRPLPVQEVSRFDNDLHRRRLSVKPGLTCLWQISGRNDISDFEDWVRLDLAYIDGWSLWLDFKILVATVPAVLTARGAR